MKPIMTHDACRAPSEFSLDVWDLKNPGTPQVLSTKIISTEVKSQSRAAESIAFSKNAASFVLESRVLDTCRWENPIFLQDRNPDASVSPLSIDFDKRGDVFVVASRNLRPRSRAQKPLHRHVTLESEVKISEDVDTDDHEVATPHQENDDGPGNDAPLDKCDEKSDAESSEDESEDISDDSLLSSSEDENSAYETYSEGSTDFESESETSEDESEGSSSTDSPESDVESDLGSGTSGSATRLGKPQSATFLLKSRLPMDKQLKFEADLSGRNTEERPTYPGLPGRFRSRDDRITATVAVYMGDSSQAVRAFHYDNDIPAMLYQSPPVLHPHQPLLVWPLAGGEILFADYMEKTYFVRAVMPTTSNSQFSSDVAYLYC